MNTNLEKTIQQLQFEQLSSAERRTKLQPLIDFIQEKTDEKKEINLNFICTHNSRRSHLAQVWAQAAAAHFKIEKVACYSGGTEETALYPKVAETLLNQGFDAFKIGEGSNPVYAIKFEANSLPILGFSKKYDSAFNPTSSFAAILTCSQAEEACPFIAGAEKRIGIPFEDPKISDSTPEQSQVYADRSLQIASEMFYVFSKIK
ncbi:low molecular weight phosphatase family protein [Chryseobacterium sp. A321]